MKKSMTTQEAGRLGWEMKKKKHGEKGIIELLSKAGKAKRKISKGRKRLLTPVIDVEDNPELDAL